MPKKIDPALRARAVRLVRRPDADVRDGRPSRVVVAGASDLTIRLRHASLLECATQDSADWSSRKNGFSQSCRKQATVPGRRKALRSGGAAATDAARLPYR